MSSADTMHLAGDEASLLARLRAGDEAAFELVVRTYSGRLLAVARRIVGSDDDARDAVQDGLLSAFRSLDRFEGGSLLSTWLHRIVVNAALMRVRSRRRRPEESIEPLLPVYREDGHHAETFSTWAEPVDVALARALGISANAVKIRLHRARQALRTLLAPHFRSTPS